VTVLWTKQSQLITQKQKTFITQKYKLIQPKIYTKPHPIKTIHKIGKNNTKINLDVHYHFSFEA